MSLLVFSSLTILTFLNSYSLSQSDLPTLHVTSHSFALLSLLSNWLVTNQSTRHAALRIRDGSAPPDIYNSALGVDLSALSACLALHLLLLLSSLTKNQSVPPIFTTPAANIPWSVSLSFNLECPSWLFSTIPSSIFNRYTFSFIGLHRLCRYSVHGFTENDNLHGRNARPVWFSLPELCLRVLLRQQTIARIGLKSI